ncbi:hypothetical protein [Haloprofundus halophilus]|uniref:hypothetical protein n=1 Tax=Haloprofundus halophilus TaxID=2283527 RepID=UPI000E434B80|nr:hypothetical protein [Haloprofundus halophilus]
MSVKIDRPGSTAVPTTRVSRYDLLLALIPTLLLAGLLAGLLSTLSLAHGAALGGLVAATLVGYGLFVDSPVDPTTRPPGGARRAKSHGRYRR